MDRQALEASNWGFHFDNGMVADAGWQNEIAIWNVATIAMFICALRAFDDVGFAIPGLTLMSTLFFINHIDGLCRAHANGVPKPAYTHWLGAILNGIALLIYSGWWVLSWRAARRPQTDDKGVQAVAHMGSPRGRP